MKKEKKQHIEQEMKDVEKNLLIDQIASHMNEIAKLCEGENIDYLDMSFKDGVYKFSNYDEDIFFKEETELHKKQVSDLQELLELKKELAKDGIYV